MSYCVVSVLYRRVSICTITTISTINNCVHAHMRMCMLKKVCAYACLFFIDEENNGEDENFVEAREQQPWHLDDIDADLDDEDDVWVYVCKHDFDVLVGICVQVGPK